MEGVRSTRFPHLLLGVKVCHLHIFVWRVALSMNTYFLDYTTLNNNCPNFLDELSSWLLLPEVSYQCRKLMVSREETDNWNKLDSNRLQLESHLTVYVPLHKHACKQFQIIVFK